MRVLFIGSTKRGFLALQTLVEAGAELVGVLSLRQDEHEKERYERRIAEFAARLHVPLHETKWLNDRDYADIIRNRWRPDIAFVVGCRLRLPREIYTAPPAGTLAVHDSCLPEYRGFAPLNWAYRRAAHATTWLPPRLGCCRPPLALLSRCGRCVTISTRT